LKIAARDIGLPIHQIDSFSQYDPTKFGTDINLIVAVSFGLLIPAQVIGSAKYGGLNVHPSLLPE
jgi:methionyl-tRNA formyltransferase